MVLAPSPDHSVGLYGPATSSRQESEGVVSVSVCLSFLLFVPAFSGFGLLLLFLFLSLTYPRLVQNILRMTRLTLYQILRLQECLGTPGSVFCFVCFNLDLRVCCLHVCTHNVGPVPKGGRGVRIPAAGGCGPLCGCGESNLACLQESQCFKLASHFSSPNF